MSVLVHRGGRKMGPARRYGLHVAGQLWYAAWRNRNRQLTRHAYPGQSSTRAQHVPPPCLCWYWTEAHGLRITGGVGSYTFDSQANVYATGFQINPACRHHGHIANTHLIERMWDDPYGYGLLRDPYDLDDDERKD